MRARARAATPRRAGAPPRAWIRAPTDRFCAGRCSLPPRRGRRLSGRGCRWGPWRALAEPNLRCGRPSMVAARGARARLVVARVHGAAACATAVAPSSACAAATSGTPFEAERPRASRSLECAPASELCAAAGARARRPAALIWRSRARASRQHALHVCCVASHEMNRWKLIRLVKSGEAVLLREERESGQYVKPREQTSKGANAF